MESKARSVPEERLAQLRLREDARVLRDLMKTSYWEVFSRRAREIVDRNKENALSPDHGGRPGSAEFRKGVYFGTLDVLSIPDTLWQWVGKQDEEESRDATL